MVQFCGEGGDCVIVDMATVEQGNDAEAINRAKSILVQTATFDSAVNDYDARSNGNFDEVDVASASDENGGIYIFEYRDGAASRQVPPSRMPNLKAARDEAVRCAIELLADIQPVQDSLTGWLVRVRGEGGDLLCAVDVQEAEAARRSGQ